MPARSPDGVLWRDLVRLTRTEVARELLLSFPWLVGSLVAAEARLWAVALPLSFFFFLTGLRQVHNCYHDAIGLSRRQSDVFLAIMSALMLGSMHAVRTNHLRHHKDPLGPEDVEAEDARLPAWRAILAGPTFPARLVRTALRIGTARDRRWITAEVAINLALYVVVFALTDVVALRYQLIAMTAGQSLTAFFCVWTVHHDTDRATAGRTMRHERFNAISFGMFYHAEHHLFPRVPTCHLPELAKRIDAVAPHLTRARVLGADARA